MVLKNHMASDSDANSANKGLPVTLSDAGFGESDRVEMRHMASTQSSLGMSTYPPWHVVPSSMMLPELN